MPQITINSNIRVEALWVSHLLRKLESLRKGLWQEVNVQEQTDDSQTLLVYDILFFSFFKFLSLFNYTCLHFLPTRQLHPSQTYLPAPLWFCPCVLHSSSWKPFSPLSLPPSPLAIVRLFLTSMSLVIFCLFFSFVDYVPVKGEIIWYLSLTAWLISPSIMLSSSIHAVAKGISSFFLSAV